MYYFDTLDIKYYSAIVDIPELEQSYWIMHEHSDNPDNPNLSTDGQYVVLCLVDSGEIIYPDFGCKSRYETGSYNFIAEKYLNLLQMRGILVSVRKDDPTQIDIIIVDYLNDGNDDEYFVEKVKDNLRVLGIYPGLFNYNIIHSSSIPDFKYEAG